MKKIAGKDTITLFHKTQRRQPSLLSRFVVVSAKTFTAYLFVYELANYTYAFFLSLDFCIVLYSSKGSEITNSIVLD